MSQDTHPASEAFHVFLTLICFWLSPIFYNAKIQMVYLGLTKANHKTNVIQICPGSV